MLNAIKFIGLLEKGSSQCFRVLASDNNYWIVRAKKNMKNAKRLYNEFFSRKLALEFGIFSPNVEMIELPSDHFKDFEDNLENEMEGFDNIMNKAVATKYIDNLNSIMPPPNISCTDKDFPDANLKHLLDIFGQGYEFDHFYGYRIFSEWILLEDKGKYENLFISDIKIPIFLDFDLAFSGGEWDSLPENYDHINMSFFPPFCEGINFKIEHFNKWIDKVTKLDKSHFREVLKNIPEEWDVPDHYSTNLLNLLFDQKEDFINEFIEAIKYEQENKEFKRKLGG